MSRDGQKTEGNTTQTSLWHHVVARRCATPSRPPSAAGAAPALSFFCGRRVRNVSRTMVDQAHLAHTGLHHLGPSSSTWDTIFELGGVPRSRTRRRKNQSVQRARTENSSKTAMRGDPVIFIIFRGAVLASVPGRFLLSLHRAVANKTPPSQRHDVGSVAAVAICRHADTVKLSADFFLEV